MRTKVSFAILAITILASALPALAAGGGEVVSMRRLTEQEYRNSIADIFGKDIVVQGVFEPGKRIGGLIEASAAILSITPVGFDSYSKMADSIAVLFPASLHRPPSPMMPAPANSSAITG